MLATDRDDVTDVYVFEVQVKCQVRQVHNCTYLKSDFKVCMMSTRLWYISVNDHEAVPGCEEEVTLNPQEIMGLNNLSTNVSPGI